MEWKRNGEMGEKKKKKKKTTEIKGELPAVLEAKVN